MRTLINRERTGAAGFLDEIAAQVLLARRAVNRATDGSPRDTAVEIDFALSSAEEIADIAAVLAEYLRRLAASTANSREGRGGGITAPRRHAYQLADPDPADPTLEISHVA